MSNNVWVWDIETLDTESSSVVLSVALIYFEAKNQIKISDLRKQSKFIKFAVAEQRSRYNRTLSKETLDWWSIQSRESQLKSLIPSSTDVTVEDGFQELREFFHVHGGTKNSYVYSRGAFDAIVLESLNKSAGLKPIIHFSNYRDIRTFIDLMYPKAKGGYIEVDKSLCLDWDESTMVKHDPEDDCLMDIAQMLCGVQ